MPVQKTKQYPQKGKDNEASVVSFEHDDVLADIVNPFKSPVMTGEVTSFHATLNDSMQNSCSISPFLIPVLMITKMAR